MAVGGVELTALSESYFPFFGAPAALAFAFAAAFFWFLSAASCFFDLSFAFGDLSPMVYRLKGEGLGEYGRGVNTRPIYAESSGFRRLPCATSPRARAGVSGRR